MLGRAGRRLSLHRQAGWVPGTVSSAGNNIMQAGSGSQAGVGSGTGSVPILHHVSGWELHSGGTAGYNRMSQGQHPTMPVSN